MGLTVVSVSYPFAPVTPDPVGGAEQVLAHLDRTLTRAGHRSIVIAPEGSSAAGELRPVSPVPAEVTDEARARIYGEVRARLSDAMDRDSPDVIHLHGIDFASYLPRAGPAVLATLHLPLDWYNPEALNPRRPRTFLYPVSESQARRAPTGTMLQRPIENGVEIAPIIVKKRPFALALGRICPEKGFEDAIAASEKARVPLLLAGVAFPYPEHQSYLRTKILPRLEGARRWIGAVAGPRKKRLLAQARCVLVPSKAPETSSLVAMEALAAGTPVIAYRSGALPDIVEHCRTGFIVDTVDEMGEAIGQVEKIDPEECRAEARRRFPLEKMTGTYLQRYLELAGG